MKKRADFFSEVSLFRAFTSKDLVKLAGLFEDRVYQDKQVIIQEGESSEEIFIIHTGCVNVFRSGDRHPIFLSTLGVKDLFGEAAIFPDLTRTATLEAKGQTSVFVITRTALMKYIEQNPKAGCSLLVELLRRVFLKLQHTTFELRAQRNSGLTQEAIDKLLNLV